MLYQGSLAQLVEQWTLNPFVAGSTPARPTKIITDSKLLEFLFLSSLQFIKKILDGKHALLNDDLF